MNPLVHQRQQILQQMEQIQRMERGSLQSETRPSLRHPKQDRGPYFKHQVWEDGQNVTRRIPAQKADALAQAIEGRKQFEKLADEFIEATVMLTRAETSPDAKKTRRNPGGPPHRNRRLHRAVLKPAPGPAAIAELRADLPGTDLPVRRQIAPTTRSGSFSPISA
jgi:hypothetical protein